MSEARLKEQILALSRLDVSRRIFGSGHHVYALEPVQEAEVSRFEAWFGCRLPHEYREFITKVGIGAGPYYGLKDLAWIRDEMSVQYEDYEEEHGTAPRGGDVLDFKLQQGNEGGAWQQGPSTTGGYVPICHHGCDKVAALVTSGPLAGRVFDAAEFAMVGPASRPAGVVEHGHPGKSLSGFVTSPTFLQWFEGWLEQAFHDLRSTSGISRD